MRVWPYTSGHFDGVDIRMFKQNGNGIVTMVFSNVYQTGVDVCLSYFTNAPAYKRTMSIIPRSHLAVVFSRL